MCLLCACFVVGGTRFSVSVYDGIDYFRVNYKCGEKMVNRQIRV